ncbi:MAG: carbonic anhydrase [Gemmataceae bacterium]|nr:carbonic anhydrase [Gemmataceae bacterium]
MTRIIQGVFGFQKKAFLEKEDLFQKLGKGQSPLALFITCSDSRINPNLLTQTEPGELFILRNAGNLIPPASTGPCGEEATVEYALVQLGIKDIFVCGHSKCGAIQGLVTQALGKESHGGPMPAVENWLKFAGPNHDIIKEKAAELGPDKLLTFAIEQNVLKQVIHLQTYPAVQNALGKNQLRIHPWVYRIDTGDVTAEDYERKEFLPLDKARRQKWAEQAHSQETVHHLTDVYI